LEKNKIVIESIEAKPLSEAALAEQVNTDPAKEIYY
jgi:hypothetical protein